VAFSNATSSAGASFDAPSKESAMATAVENCKKNGGGDDCKVFKVTEERGFAAVYMACASGCGVTAVTGRPSQLQARMDGRQDCQRYYKMPCKLAVEWKERGYQDPTRMAAAPPPPKPVFENKPDDYYRAFAAIKGFKDCAECPEMVNIPAGSFDMGWPARDGEKADQHRVSITGFAMGRTEVTVGQWTAFMRATGRIMAEIGCRANILVQKTVKVQGWRNPGYPISDAHPVSCVDWEDAQAYVEWLTYKTKKPYRLPSEAEWEYAAWAGTTTTFPWGDDPQQACKHANVYDMTAEAVDRSIGANPFKHCNDGQLYPTAVASYLPNRFGLYDMIGNL
jgi:formylglycine-generating enzyme required for sulfatase activity